MKSCKIFLNIVSFICFVFGALYCFSLVFIPVGVYCFIAGKKFAYKADHMVDSFAIDKKTMYGYSIFVSIVCFPFGLLIWISYNGLFGNNVKVEGFNYQKINEVPKDENDVEPVQEKQETDAEKLEKLEKLKNFKEKGIISEEEFEMAKEQMFGKDKD